MHLTSVFLCVTLLAVIEAYPISRPKLNGIVPRDKNKVESQEITTIKSPEERRKLSVFPKSNKKFLVTLDQDQDVAVSPVRVTKKPVMKKIAIKTVGAFQGAVTSLPKTKQPVKNEEKPKERNPKIIDEDHSIEVLLGNSEEHKEVKLSKDIPETNKHVKVSEASSEEDSKEDENVEENIKANLDKVVKIPEVVSKKHEDVSKESSEEQDVKDNEVETQTGVPDELNDDLKPEHKEVVPVEIRTKENPEQVQVEGDKEQDQIDWREYIIVEPIKRLEIVVDIGESVETTTTDYIEEPIALRNKRSDNVIEEENIATTISGHKFTWTDTRLTNDIKFRNINS